MNDDLETARGIIWGVVAGSLFWGLCWLIWVIVK